MSNYVSSFSSLPSQEEKDSDSSKETLDDLFPDDQDDQAPGSKCSTLLLFPSAHFPDSKMKKVDLALGDGSEGRAAHVATSVAT